MIVSKEVLKFLKGYSTDQNLINRLIVSSFLFSQENRQIKNELINSLIIQPSDIDFQNLTDFLKIQPVFSLEEVIGLFEFVISPSDKKITGAIYTPKFIRDFILESVLSKISDWEKITICDPACGCAGFLFTAAIKLREFSNKSFKDIFRENIFGCDIQKFSITRSKILLSLLAISYGEDEHTFQFNLMEANSLTPNWYLGFKVGNGFDAIVGNPPYVCSRNIDTDSRELLKHWKVCASGHPDLYIPFFQIGMLMLKRGGILSYITMNTFLNSVNGRALREYFQDEKFKINLIDFGGEQIFNNKATYTCICEISKIESDVINYTRISNLDDFKNRNYKLSEIRYSSLTAVSSWNLHQYDLIYKIEKTGTPLGKKFKSRNGIATLRNDVYILSILHEDALYYYTSGEVSHKIEKQICKDIVNANRFINIDNIELIGQKIIFPYEYHNGKPKLIPETELLNKFPSTYAYLTSNKEILSQRDKGTGVYENWYAYGRNQSLDKYKYKLFFPHISNKIPKFVLNADENLLFYNGLAMVSDDISELIFLSKLMSTELFWFYIVTSSRHYGSEYFSLSKNYFKNFGVYDFSIEERSYIIAEDDMSKVNEFVECVYQVEGLKPAELTTG